MIVDSSVKAFLSYPNHCTDLVHIQVFDIRDRTTRMDEMVDTLTMEPLAATRCGTAKCVSTIGPFRFVASIASNTAKRPLDTRVVEPVTGLSAAVANESISPEPALLICARVESRADQSSSIGLQYLHSIWC